MEAFSLPLAIGGFVVHTSFSLMVAFLSYLLIGLLAPLFFFLTGIGSFPFEKYNGAAHLAVWPSMVLGGAISFWAHQGQLSLYWTQNKAGMIAAWCIILFLWLLISVLIDSGLSVVYQKIKNSGHEVVKLWLGAAFFTGCLPAVILLSVEWLTWSNPLGLDAYFSFFILLQTRTIVFYLKIMVAMATFAIFLYYGAVGSRARRACQVIFTALIWLILAFLPLILSLNLPSGAWRILFDPAYFSIYPVISDLWLCGASIWLGFYLTHWIDKEADRAREKEKE